MNKGLTSYRFFAFFIVFLFHFGLFEFGYMGVHAFFVLSGFLLTPILLEMKESLPTKSYYLNFYGRRALRIFPLYFTYLVIIGLVAYFAVYHFEYDVNHRLSRTIDQLGYAATYTYNFFTLSESYLQTQTLTHFWSLAVEEQFYLLWPMILMFSPREKIRYYLLFLILLGPIVRAAVAWAATQWPESFNRFDMVAYTFTFSSFDAFAIGGLFSVFVKNIKWRTILLLTATTFLVGVVTEYMIVGKLDFTALGYKPFMSDSYKHIWGFSLFSIIFACTLVKIRNREFLPMLFENRFLVYLGTISYGLYVYHFPIMYFFNHEASALSAPIRLVLIFGLTFVTAMLSYELLEKQFLKKKDILFKHGENSKPIYNFSKEKQ